MLTSSGHFFPQQTHKKLRLRNLLFEGHHCRLRLAAGISRAAEHMTHKSRPLCGVPSRNMAKAHPPADSLRSPQGNRRLDAAIFRSNHIAASAGIEAGNGLISLHTHGKNSLVAVMPCLRCGKHLFHGNIAAPDTAQSILHPLPLHGKLLGVIHVHEAAAAALTRKGAFRGLPVGRCFFDLQNFCGADILSRLCDLHAADLSPKGSGDKHGSAPDAGNALPLGGIAGDLHRRDLLFKRLCHDLY